jgi:flagellin
MTVSLTANNAARVAASALYKATNSHQASLEKLATGNRINSAKDDPGSIQKVSRLTSEARGIQMGIQNALQFQSILSIGDNTNLEISNELQSLREKSILAMNSTYSAQDRADLQTDAAQIIAGADQLATVASYNSQTLTDGTFTTKTISLGGSTANQITISLDSARTAALGQYYISGTAHLKIAASNDTAAVTDVTSQTLSIAGKATASVSIATGSSAKTAAAAVNATTATTGVSATASTTLKLDNLANLASGKSNSFKIGSTQIASTLVTSSDLSALATTINLSTASTGVTAVVGSSNSELLLSNTDGADILIDDFLTTNTADSTASLQVTAVNSRTGVEVGSAVSVSHEINTTRQASIDSVLAIGQLEIGYHESFSMTGGASTATRLVLSSSDAFTVASDFVSAIDISTQAGATAAVRVLDSALAKVSANRASIGATSSRLDSATNFLTAINIPVSMSISQIQDTDFASETLNLTKSQLIRDNAAAMLAQANSSMGSIQEKILGGL